jgi:hypothetical protein
MVVWGLLGAYNLTVFASIREIVRAKNARSRSRARLATVSCRRDGCYFFALACSVSADALASLGTNLSAAELMQ